MKNTDEDEIVNSDLGFAYFVIDWNDNNKKFENRILSGLFLGVVAVLFFIAT